MNKSGYKRYPTISKLGTVFVSEDDLWEVPSTGGVARRLTSNSGEVSFPHYSPDGKHIAFTGKEEGEKDVYVIPSMGGANRRLTFLGRNTNVIGWTPDGKEILFATSALSKLPDRTEIWKISIDGGQPKCLNLGPANNIAFGPDKQVLLGRNTLDPARWKRYKGGTAGVFWIDRKSNGKFERFLSDINGNLASPMWIGDRIYFISDHEGIGTLYSCDVNGKSITKHSMNRNYYVRNATTDGSRIVYHCGAEIFVYDTEQDREWQIDIQYHSPQIQRQRKFVEAGRYLEDYNISPDGTKMIATTRGKPFVFSNWEGPVIQTGKTHGVRYRLTNWLHDGESLVTISDEDGVEFMEVHSLTDEGGKKPVKKIKSADIGIVARLKVSPKEKKIAVSNNRYDLFLIDLEKEKITKIARSNFERIEDFSFSPDGKWVAYSMSNAEFLGSVYLYNLDTGKSTMITPPGFRDTQPVWDPDGRFLYFLSAREFNPVYDTSYFQLGFPLGVRPYLITLKKETRSPFTPEYRQIFKKKKGGNKGKKDKSELAVEVDFDGIQDRIFSFPLPEKNYFQIAAVKDGLVCSREPINGSLHHWFWEKHPSDEALDRFDFNSQKVQHIAKKVMSFRVSMNGKSLVYRHLNSLYLKADIFEEADDSGNSSNYSGKSDWLDLTRLKVNIDPMSEWKQMYNEAWRLQKEHFWTPDMSGVDWKAVYERYYPLLDKIATRSEFSDLIWEMQGELGTSHAYEWGGDYKPSPNYKLGSLCANFEYDQKEKAYRIVHIIKGDSWKSNSPLMSPGADIEVGDYLIEINGQRLNAQTSPAALLVNQANSVVSLTVKSKKSGKVKSVDVKTVASDYESRYREWVETKRKYVHERSKGKLGYLHIPDMGPDGYSEFHRYYIYESAREGLIVDIRDNGGGHVSQLILEKLSRKQLGYDIARGGNISPYPSHSVAGPIVAVTDEYAGSDGDIFSHNFKQMKLGTLVGKRTWGGVIGINPKLALADGTLTSQPEFAFYMKDVGWGVENYGTDPDIEIDMTPQDYADGKDPQLDKAIEIAMNQMKNNPVSLPDFSIRPHLPVPGLSVTTNGNGAAYKKKLKKG